MLSELKPYPEYTGSGISWLGEIPSHWESQRQQNVARLLVSNVDKKVVDGEKPVRLCNYVDVYRNDRIRNGSTYMKATATQSEIESFQLQHGDVVITKDSERWDDIGVPALIEYEAEDFICGYHLAILRTRSKRVIGEFLYYATRSPGVAAQYWVSANGVTRFGLSQNTIKNILMPVPSLEEQTQIVRFLRFAETRIKRLTRNKRRLIGLLREQKLTIINQAVTCGIDPNVSRKPSGIPWLGDIPEHWEVARSGRLFFEVVDTGYRNAELLSIVANIGIVRQSDTGRKTRASLDRSSYKRIRTGELGYNLMNAFSGAIGVSEYDGILSPAYAVARPRVPMKVWFYHRLYQTPTYKMVIDQHSYGIMYERNRLYFERFKLIPVPYPPPDEQEAILRYIKHETKTIDTAISRAEREITLINEYRTRLISDVVTGKVDVRDVVINDDELEELESDALDVVEDDLDASLEDEEAAD